jgi:hypothetical protein
MVATYQLQPSELNRVEAPDEKVNEYRNSEGFLVRGGVIVPKGKEEDTLYTPGSIRRLNESMAQIDSGDVIVKTFDELEAMVK